MEVILRQDIDKVGLRGEVVNVARGYARNFLFPRGLAVEANRKNLHVLEHQKRVIAAKADRERKGAEGVAQKLNGLKLTVAARAGEEGRLFGSVTNIDVERLLTDKGFQIDRRRIELADPIKQLGTYPIVIQVGREVRATVELTVVAE
jgi:large subunit ribosomal protein L9